MWSIISYFRVFTTINSTNLLFTDGSGLDSAINEKIVYKFPDSRIAAANSIAADSFPSDFLFGAGNSAYQTEGAWNESDKSPSMWDVAIHEQPELIKDHTNADVAADSYHKYKEDIELVQRLGANSYRISLSWSRILPDGFNNRTSETGVAHYNDVINEILRRGMIPSLTMYHYDLPQRLQGLGGWSNPSIVDWFADYARVLFEQFGDRVKLWTTLNQVIQVCWQPNYVCIHHALLAHAAAYHVYDQEFRYKQKGKVGMTLRSAWPTPLKSRVKEHVDAAARFFEFWNGYVLHPIFHPDGDYPPIMRSRIDRFSEIQGLEESRLPVFTPRQIEMIKGSADYVGINFYHSTIVRPKLYNSTSASFFDDAGAESIPGHEMSFEEQSTPEAMVRLIDELNARYKIPMMYIMENGIGDHGELMDFERAKYHYEHLVTLLKVLRSGVDVRGYYAWSLIDSFEWLEGYTRKYGLYSVDFDDPERKRTAKLSTEVLGEIYKSMKIPKIG